METRRRANLDVRMNQVTRPMRVTRCNLPLANCGNDQDLIAYSYMWPCFVSFQPLRFVLLVTTSKRFLNAWAWGLHTPIEYNLKHHVCQDVSSVLRTFSGCPTAQSSRCVLSLLGEKVDITRTDAATSPPDQGLGANKVNKQNSQSSLLRPDLVCSVQYRLF